MNFKSLVENNFFLHTIGEVADELSLDAYVVGGFVRDHIMGISSKDLDIVCVGSGIKLAKKVSERLGIKKKITIYKNFGTARLVKRGVEIEFIGARKESYKRNSRNPIVEEGTLQDDQNRRDFTINSLAISLNLKSRGEFVDPFGGLDDIKNKIIRTPLDPDKTFDDDPLRILRAIRFATRLGFDITNETIESIEKNRERLNIVSPERIQGELNLTLLTAKPSIGFYYYRDYGLLDYIIPELKDLQGVEIINGQSHKENFDHTLKVLDNVAERSDYLWLRWAALLHDIAKPQTKKFDEEHGFTFHGHEELGAKMVNKIFARLRMPKNEKMYYVKKLIRLHLRPIALVKDIVTDSAIRRLIFDAGDYLEDLLLLCRADITSKNPNKVLKYLSNFDKVEKKIHDVEERDSIRNFQPVITGEIIMDKLSIKPGRLVGEIKGEIKEAILDGKIKNEYDEAYKFLIRIAKEKSIEVRKP